MKLFLVYCFVSCFLICLVYSLLLTPATTQVPLVIFRQGDCNETVRSSKFYTENFLLEADGKSQVDAVIKIEISKTPNITCVEIISRSDDEIRPYITGGGVDSNYVDVSVKTKYGKGFDFSVNLYGSIIAIKS